MDTKGVIARFEAERQALALMDHPNIAKVLDAGSAETGRPYFVIELVKGVPIVDYCDTEKSTPGPGSICSWWCGDCCVRTRTEVSGGCPPWDTAQAGPIAKSLIRSPLDRSVVRHAV
jgi:hypothetical protein